MKAALPSAPRAECGSPILWAAVPAWGAGWGHVKGLRYPAGSAKEAAQQGHKGGADEGDTAAGHELCYPQFVGTGPFFPDFMRGCIPLEINGFIPDQV